MKPTSRRALLAGIAAAPALAAPSLAVAADKATPLTPDDERRLLDAFRASEKIALREADRIKREIEMTEADAELLELGRTKLAPMIEEWREQTIEDRQRRAKYDAVCAGAGYPYRDHTTFPDLDQWRDYAEKREAIGKSVFTEEDYKDTSPWDGFHDRLYPIIDEIMKLKPKTLAGLAVQAQAMSLSECDLWDDDKDEDDRVRKFIELVCAFTSVAPVALTLPA